MCQIWIHVSNLLNAILIDIRGLYGKYKYSTQIAVFYYYTYIQIIYRQTDRQTDIQTDRYIHSTKYEKYNYSIYN